MHESLDRDAPRCPNGGMRHLINAGIVKVLLSIIKDAGIPIVSVVIEARGLRATNISRPGDVTALDFSGEGRHLGIDAVHCHLILSEHHYLSSCICSMIRSNAVEREEVLG